MSSHKVLHRSFGRDTKHRQALFKNLVSSLVRYERIKVTLAKAKELKRHVERAVTLAKKPSVHTRRLLLTRCPNKELVSKLIDKISPRFKDRPGGYTRIIKLGARPGDQSEMGFIEFVDYKAPSKSEVKGLKKDIIKLKKTKIKKAEKTKKRLRKISKKSRRLNRK